MTTVTLGQACRNLEKIGYRPFVCADGLVINRNRTIHSGDDGYCLEPVVFPIVNNNRVIMKDF